MSVVAKIAKAASVLQRPRARSALLRHHVAAAVEHFDAISFCSPGSLIDIGANKGQFSVALRTLLPQAPIHAFEPLPQAAERYASVFADDPNTSLHRFAIAEEAGNAILYVTDREDSSSLHRPGPKQAAAFGVREASQIEVPIRPLEDIINLSDLPRPIMMKIDVQGAELEVLQGCKNLEMIDFIYVELSFIELYDKQALFSDVNAYLNSRGFALRGVFNQVLTDRFGPTQADCLFVPVSER